MNHVQLYSVLQKTPDRGEYTLACVLDGCCAGEQLLLCQNRPCWTAGGTDLLRRHCSVLQDCTTTGVLQMDGQRVFVERFGAVPQLVVCGGGHVGVAVVRMAKLLGLPVLAVDDREDCAAQLQSAGADTVLTEPFESALAHIPGGAESYFVVVTRAHTYDVACLRQILRKSCAYVGMMGSRSRAALVRRQLLEQGVDAGRVEALYAPIGLSIGSQTAEEIALSILAQIISVKNRHSQSEGFPSALRNAMEHADTTGQKAVLATIVERHGSTPRETGAKMLILADGTTVGSVGGGIMEHYTVQAARKMLAQAAPALQCLQLSADGKNEDAAIAACGGSMEVLLQTLCPGEETK